MSILEYYGSLASCSNVDAEVTCGSTCVCAAQGGRLPAPKQDCLVRPAAQVRWGSPLESVDVIGADTSRCIYRTEGATPAMVCKVVDQWPEFVFGDLRPWDSQVQALACPPLCVDAVGE